jgi:rhodanese-related sulfurtransferase
MNRWIFSSRGIPAVILIFGAVLLAAFLFFPVSPNHSPPPSTYGNAVAGIAAGRLDPAAADSSRQGKSALYVSVESVRALLKRKQDVLFVDVRGKRAFEQFRLPGSIRVPLHALKTKTFLKGRSVVLVSEGYPDLVLERACRDLQTAGFAQTCILNGGLRWWQQKSGFIEGDAFAASQLSRLAPIDFLSHQGAAEWLVITVSPSTSAAGRTQQLIPGALHLPWTDNPTAFAAALKSIVADKVQSPRFPVLVCDESGARYDRIERAIQQEEVGMVFYLGGGLQAYEAFLEQQSLLRQPGKEQAKPCATCS